MKTKLLTAALYDAVSVDDLRSHMRVDITEDDPYIIGCMKAATAFVEEWSGRKLIQETWYAYYDSWPGCGYFTLPYAPLIGLNSSSTGIVYYDSDGSTQTPDTTTYTVDTVSEPGRVVLRNDASWPSDALFNNNPIRIEFKAGHSTGGSSDVPPALKHAVSVLTADMYENRNSYVVGASVTPLKDFVRNLVYSQRIWSF